MRSKRAERGAEDLRKVKFQQVLEKIRTEGVLDLTSWTLFKKECQQIVAAIAQYELSSACIIGLNPKEYAVQIVQELQKKSAHQKTRFQILHTEELGADLTAQFDSQFRRLADSNLKTSMRFEPSRLSSAISKGPKAFMSQIGKEFKGEVPQFGGEENATKVLKVRKLSNPTIERNYNGFKDLSKSKVIPQFLSVQIQTIQTGDTELQEGEMLLFHGTRKDISSLIMKNGFDENYCKHLPGNGYGPLGKGVYFTSELSKAATFAQCSQCGASELCYCTDEATLQPVERVVLLSRVYVGNPEILLSKNPLIKENFSPTAGFDSYIALSKTIEPDSVFRSTEICVPYGAQTIPLYEISFSFTPNYLLPHKWPEMLKRIGFNEIQEIRELLEVHKELLKEFHALKIAGANSSEINEKGKALYALSRDILSELVQLRAGIRTDGPGDQENQQQIQSINKLCAVFLTFQTQIQDQLAANESTVKAVKAQGVNPSAPSSRTMMSYFLPQQYALKQELLGLRNKLNSTDPKELVHQLKASLDFSIKRDQKKSSGFMLASNPPHRVLLTQAMLRLRKQLEKIDETDLAQASSLLGSTLDDLKNEAKQHPNILNATAYKSMNDFAIQIESNLASEKRTPH